MSYLLREAEVDGRIIDVRLENGKVTALGPGLDATGAEVVEGHGRALIPGLTDHHLHLLALAAELRSVHCGPPHDADSLRAALAAAEPDRHGWIRGTGYIESVAGQLNRWKLDELYPAGPVRIQHRSGAMWMLNSEAAQAVGLDGADLPGVERDSAGRATGRLWREDDWLRANLPPAEPLMLDVVGRTLTRHGITAVADATPDLDTSAIKLITAAQLPQEVLLLGAPLGAAGHTGPYKIVIADSALPGIDELTSRIRAAHSTGRPVAVHCVSREALFLLIAALHETGTVAGDRIEHASVVPEEALPLLKGLGVRVVTQPGFLADRGDDYLRDVERDDQPGLYRVASLGEYGIPVALSSDAPYGPLNPWEVIAAAVNRRTATRQVVGAAEAISPRAALDAYLCPADDPGGEPRRVRVGSADLVLLDAPLAEVLNGRTNPVCEVFVAGQRFSV
ncbi:amidohydrolase family protein [Amycolatopsis acidicola]|uniref:Amidohydrolase family protein n=1 Tax=Amycolatopsis acidicola TaxID=2596893 RepID=A0A5N0UKS9_9PSEU|nr:amidohydrolase family protein [Amycolatopsis acidicola]KAA9150216.1 amidohydrolase family protein [Amycolatopsis acidicola]